MGEKEVLLLTDEQKRQIIEMRKKGIGYKAIATELNLSRDTVRNYCKNNDLLGYGTACSMNVNTRINSGKACDHCGKSFEQPLTGRPKKFCSDSCRRAWWKAHPEKINRRDTAFYEFSCRYCGKEFKAYGNKNRGYCSHFCYVKDRFWREEEGREPYVSPRIHNKKLKVSKELKVPKEVSLIV